MLLASQVLAHISHDPSLDKFRQEYEKLYKVLKKTHGALALVRSYCCCPTAKYRLVPPSAYCLNCCHRRLDTYSLCCLLPEQSLLMHQAPVP